MNEAELKAIKDNLLVRKEQLQQELERLSNIETTDGQSQDEGDQAVQSTLETLRNSLQKAEYDELLMIEEALNDIENGVYGNCQDCDNQISEKRLKYYPNARRCLMCQEAVEGL
jgi:DnaK suppressor protein